MFKFLFGIAVTGYYEHEMSVEYPPQYMIFYMATMLISFFVTCFGIRVSMSIRTYEKSSNFHIVFLIASTNVLLALCFTGITIFTESQLSFIVIIPLAYLLICFLLVGFLYRFNISQFRKLNKYHREEYTLSRRYQLKENIRLLSLLMKMIYAVVAFIAIMVAGFTLPVVLKFGHITGDSMRAIVDFCVHCNPLIVIPMTTFFIPEFKKAVFKRVARCSVDSHHRNYQADSNQGDVYFDLFKKSIKRNHTSPEI
uniref:G_PROTEIN_RECEP_F1_2 domain-containing protein n=1 Tax=Caenorhabditis tropicalis TaxID=1561998 RepID=A0A1I7TAE2_9PELO